MKESIVDPILGISKILESNGFGKDLRPEHITYDKSVNEEYEYQVIRESSHDGTLLFTMQLIDKALISLINKQTFSTKTYSEEYLRSNLKDVNYRIGDMRLETEFKTVKGFPGQTDTVYIPVVCEYIFG